MIRAVLTALAFAATVAPAAQAAEAWRLDSAHTQVLFTVSHLGFTELTGQFRSVEAELNFDTDDWSKSSVIARIDAASVDMNHDGINRHLRNPDFFDVEAHPHLEFRSHTVEQIGADKLRVDGDLSMIGVTVPLSLFVTVNKLANHPMRGTPWVGFRAEATLKRSDWGMDYGVPGVGDDIGIVINLEAGGPAAAE